MPAGFCLETPSKSNNKGGGKMAPRLGALVALAEDQG